MGELRLATFCGHIVVFVYGLVVNVTEPCHCITSILFSNDMIFIPFAAFVSVSWRQKMRISIAVSFVHLWKETKKKAWWLLPIYLCLCLFDVRIGVLLELLLSVLVSPQNHLSDQNVLSICPFLSHFMFMTMSVKSLEKK